MATPIPTPDVTPERSTTIVLSNNSPSFLINAANRSYKHQYANIYFVRLRILREFIEEKATRRWGHVAGKPVLIPRVLEVIKSQLCYIIGTVYMDMPLKPNVLEDIARDHSIPPPAPASKFYSQEDNVMLEDESGRIRLVGERIKTAKLVTGVIIGALGVETSTGDFEVVDVCYAEMAPQKHTDVSDEEKMDVDDTKPHPSDEWIALVSGLDVGTPSSSDAQIQMLVEYLTGEEGGPEEQMAAAQISRLIIAGNSLSQILIPVKGEGEMDKKRRYGYDSTTFSPHPTISLSAHLLDLSHVMPIHILPGETDPSGTLLPQQPFPRAMFGTVSSLPSFVCETNPTYLHIATGSEADSNNPHSMRPSITRTLLIHSGQPLNDMYKYLPSPPATRLSLLESTLRWRHMAPTAPDTLWCHPYFSSDPFLIQETPDLYIAGGQPRFGTRLVVEDGDEGEKRCRILLVPAFAKTGLLVLVNLRTLGVKTVEFGVQGMSGGTSHDVEV